MSLKKKNVSSSKCVAHDTKNRKPFTRQLPKLHNNCVLTPTVTTDVYKHHTGTCPLFTAAALLRALGANSHTGFLYISPASGAAKLS
jgi:hypothetical protein